MDQLSRVSDATERSYEATAPFYDQLTAHHDYERWLPRLVLVARRYGLTGRRLLDVACGTGKSFLPLLRAGWSVTGCDLSAGMLRRARSKARGQASLHVADMRQLPRLGDFDLVWSIDDAINYLLTPSELEGAFAGLARNLASGGRVLFDTNTLLTYQTFYSQTEVRDRGNCRLIWRGHGGARPGSQIAATFEAVPVYGASRPRLKATHRQRHFRPDEVIAALDQAGLECLAVLGQGLDGYPREPLDERLHTKAIYVASHR